MEEPKLQECIHCGSQTKNPARICMPCSVMHGNPNANPE